MACRIDSLIPIHQYCILFYYCMLCFSALLGLSIAKAVLIVLLQTVAAQGLYVMLETWRMLALYYIGVVR